MSKSTSVARWHPVLIKALIQCLKETFVDGFYADKVLERAFKANRQWGSRDRRFLAETLYDMTRWWSLLAFFDGQTLMPQSPEEFIRRWVYYEAWKNQKDAVEFVETHFPEALGTMTGEQVMATAKNTPTNAWETVAFPQWLYEKFFGDYGDLTPKILRALNAPAPVCLRTNTLKTARERLKESLASEGISATPTEGLPDALVLNERQNVFATKAFKEGLFEVQDNASQQVSTLLNPKPGERIADVCAGAGGKTLHLAALMKNKGMLLAGDVSQKKLDQLKIRARRAGVSNLKILLIDGTKAVKRNAENFDGVLIDAPCSGTGVIRRNSDTKWKLNPDELLRLENLQQEILGSYSRLVKKGGRLVYATCSLLSEENEKQIEKFLVAHPDFRREGAPLKTRPDVKNEDGFFAQRLVRF